MDRTIGKRKRCPGDDTPVLERVRHMANVARKLASLQLTVFAGEPSGSLFGGLEEPRVELVREPVPMVERADKSVQCELESSSLMDEENSRHMLRMAQLQQQKEFYLGKLRALKDISTAAPKP